MKRTVLVGFMALLLGGCGAPGGFGRLRVAQQDVVPIRQMEGVFLLPQGFSNPAVLRCFEGTGYFEGSFQKVLEDRLNQNFKHNGVNAHFAVTNNMTEWERLQRNSDAQYIMVVKPEGALCQNHISPALYSIKSQLVLRESKSVIWSSEDIMRVDLVSNQGADLYTLRVLNSLAGYGLVELSSNKAHTVDGNAHITFGAVVVR